MESDLPWIPGALRQLLLADVPFKTASHNRVSSKAPGDVNVPFSLVRVMLDSVIPLDGGGYKLLVQAEGLCVASGYGNEEAELVVWRIADRARNVFRTARNVEYQSMHYSMRPFGMGPLPQDTSRGDSNPLERAGVRAEMTIHNR